MKKFSLLITILMISIISLSLVACNSTLTVTFDAGEYGIASGDSKQVVNNKGDLVYPKIIAKEGYIFIGFDTKLSELPNRGKTIIKAEYVKLELWFIDYTTKERINSDFSYEMPSFGEGAGSLSFIMPQIEMRATNMQTGASETEIISITSNIVNHPISTIYFSNDILLKHILIEVEKNEYFFLQENFKDNLMMCHCAKVNSRDWETKAVINISLQESVLGDDGPSYIYESFAMLSFNVFKGHIRAISIELNTQTISADGNSWDVSGNVQSGYKVKLGGKVSYEDGSEYLNSLLLFGDRGYYRIERIWSIYGDEIAPENFDLYAYYISYESENGQYIQLTGLVGNGWRVEVYVDYTYDNITSNTYTIYVY